MREGIYLSKQPVKMWSMLGDYEVYLLTIVFEYKFLSFKWHRIKQQIPVNKWAYYDGELSSNERLKTLAKSEFGLAKVWLWEYKKRIAK